MSWEPRQCSEQSRQNDSATSSAICRRSGVVGSAVAGPAASSHHEARTLLPKRAIRQDRSLNAGHWRTRTTVVPLSR